MSVLGLLSGPSGGRPDPRAALAWGLYLLIVAGVQEGLFRGWLLGVLTRRLGFWRAAALSSLAFAAIHASPSQSPLGLMSMAIFGLAMCAAVRAFGSIWWAMGFHLGWDYALTFVFGFGAAPGARVMWRLAPRGPDWLSGGMAGPEASVVSVAMLMVVWAGLAWRGPGSAATRH